MDENEITWVTTPCSMANCIQVADLGKDWYRLRSTSHTRNALAFTGAELRQFALAIRRGDFDALLGLAPDTTVDDLLAEVAELRGEQAHA